MTVHYHGLPVTPREVRNSLAGRSFCVSYADPRDVEWAHSHGQSVMLDNSAYTLWRRGGSIEWAEFYEWAEPWLDYQTSWACIPDVIDGTPNENDRLIREWPFGDRGAPVFHFDEPIERLLRLADEWPRVCLGSSGQYAKVGSELWHRRAAEIFNALCGNGPPPVWVHMLRGMALCESEYPFASVDSSDVAQNHHLAHRDALKMATDWDAQQTPGRWYERHQLELGAA